MYIELRTSAGNGGMVVGRGSMATELYGIPQQPGRRYVEIEVKEAYRRQGHGAVLLQALASLARAQGATELLCKARPAEEGERFALHHGFRLDYTILAGELDLRAFDLAAWPEPQPSGIRFGTLAEVGNRAAAIQQIYDLDERTSADIPEWSGLMPPLAEYEAEQLTGHDESIFLAWAGERLVGFLTTDLTGYLYGEGVDPDYRGRGIGLALKLLAIRWAKSRGVATLSTHNNQENRAILELNRKLGFRHWVDASYYVAQL